MDVRLRWGPIVGSVVLFGAGWGTSALAHDKPARAERPQVEVVTAAATACTDPAAMQANANLVAELRGYRQRLADAEEQRAAAEAKIAKIASRAGERLATSTDEWKRMANEGTVRVRVPCSSWDGTGHFALRRSARGRSGYHVAVGSRRFEKMQRAEAAGLSSEELEALADVYRRVNARTWASVRAPCEASSEYREAIASDEEPSDESRVAACRSAMVDIDQPESRSALAHVAALRAAGAPADRAAGEREQVLFALTGAQQTLEDEMVRTFGREKTTRAIDNGVTCFDETTYDTHEPGSAG